MDKNYLENINKVISELEDAQLFKEAEDLHNLFMKTAGKKKKSKGKNVPNDPALYSRCKSEAKRKFDVWPSAYGSAYLVKLYKSRGGTFRKSNSDNNVKLGQNFTDLQPKPDEFSGYQEMSYGDVINKAKEWVKSGDEKEARSMIQSVIEYSNQLTKQEKNALSKEFNVILYSNMNYKDVITKAKELVFDGETEKAKSFIQTVINNSEVLNDAQKTALQKQFNVILGVYGDTQFTTAHENIGYNDVYAHAQGLLDKIKNYSPTEKIKAINNFKSDKSDPKFDKLVRQFAFNQLRREQMENKQR
jgi:hypothetical protein